MKLNLTTQNSAEERIKEYLEQNASETLAHKINEGTPTEKDGKALINRKTLKGFMSYATSEAQKIAEKGARFACIDDATVFGWAIHYFEEESIIGTLYNADGTEYKAIIKPKADKAPKAEPKKPTVVQTSSSKSTTPPKPTPKAKSTDTEQISFFDLL